MPRKVRQIYKLRIPRNEGQGCEPTVLRSGNPSSILLAKPQVNGQSHNPVRKTRRSLQYDQVSYLGERFFKNIRRGAWNAKSPWIEAVSAEVKLDLLLRFHREILVRGLQCALRGRSTGPVARRTVRIKFQQSVHLLLCCVRQAEVLKVPQKLRFRPKLRVDHRKDCSSGGLLTLY